MHFHQPCRQPLAQPHWYQHSVEVAGACPGQDRAYPTPPWQLFVPAQAVHNSRPSTGPQRPQSQRRTAVALGFSLFLALVYRVYKARVRPPRTPIREASCTKVAAKRCVSRQLIVTGPATALRWRSVAKSLRESGGPAAALGTRIGEGAAGTEEESR
eukprot:scaffold619_cov403-Prasinococcus_capsulatus_cf.AAC.1